MVKQGYKQTEIGVIPEDWEVKELGELGVIGSSKRIFESDYVDYGVPFYRGKEISLLMENKSIDEPYYISEEKFASLLSKYGAPQKNDLLITAVGTLGNIYHVNDNRKFYFKDGNLIWIRKIEGNSKFIKIALDYHKNQILENAIGSSQKALTIKSLSITQIPLPPLAEQEAIASALSDADRWIESLEELIAKKRLIKQGAMQTLLTPKEDWEVKKLGEVAEIKMGQSPLSENYNQNGIGLPLVQGNADIDNRKTIIRNYTSQITKRGNIGDIIMSVRAPVGEIAKATFDCCLGRGVCAIIAKNDYLYHYLIYSENNWEQFSTGSTFDSVNSNQVNDFSIAIPKSLSEQERIAGILSDMDAEIEALEAQLGKARQIKQGMMQELLTGRVRLINVARIHDWANGEETEEDGIRAEAIRRLGIRRITNPNL